MPTSFLVLWIFILILVVLSIKIASESQRFIVYRLGRFFGLKGPGLLFIIPEVIIGTHPILPGGVIHRKVGHVESTVKMTR